MTLSLGEVHCWGCWVELSWIGYSSSHDSFSYLQYLAVALECFLALKLPSYPVCIFLLLSISQSPQSRVPCDSCLQEQKADVSKGQKLAFAAKVEKKVEKKMPVLSVKKPRTDTEKAEANSKENNEEKGEKEEKEEKGDGTSKNVNKTEAGEASGGLGIGLAYSDSESESWACRWSELVRSHMALASSELPSPVLQVFQGESPEKTRSTKIRRPRTWTRFELHTFVSRSARPREPKGCSWPYSWYHKSAIAMKIRNWGFFNETMTRSRINTHRRIPTRSWVH